jgi:hypothetical protein
MTKQVTFDEDLNQVREFERIPPEEKYNFWISKAEIKLFRKEMQAEALMEQAKELVKNTVLEMSKKAEEDEEVRQVVEKVMSQGIDGVLDFLSQHGNSILPTVLPTDTTNSNTETAVPAGNVDPELQVRNMVKHKLIFVQKETFLSHEDLELQVDQIMLLPRPKIVEFLEHAKPSQLAVKEQPSTPFNWMTDSTDYWADLPEEIQQAAGDLGYDEVAWNTGQQPEESDKMWEDLTPKQQAAAAKIGYNPYTWDGIEPPPAAGAAAVPEPMTQEQIMMQKIQELVRQKMEQEQPFKSKEELQQAIDKIMILPKDQIKGYLQKTLVVKTTAEEPPTKLQKTVLDDDDEDNKPLESSDDSSDDSSNDESDDDEQHNEEIISGFVLDVDEEDKKPMDDDSSSDSTSENDDSDVREDDGSSNEASASDNDDTADDDKDSSIAAEPTSEPRSKQAPRKDSFKAEEDELLANFMGDGEGDDGKEKQDTGINDTHEEEEFLSNFLRESKPHVGLDNMYVPSDDELDLDDDETDQQQDASSSPSKPVSSSANDTTTTFTTTTTTTTVEEDSTPRASGDALRQRSSAATITSTANNDDKNESTPLLKPKNDKPAADPQKTTKQRGALWMILPGLLLVGYGMFILGSLLHNDIR